MKCKNENVNRSKADQEQMPEELHTSQPQQKILDHQISQNVLVHRDMTQPAYRHQPSSSRHFAACAAIAQCQK
jgi:hypothetical protein